MNFRTNVTTFHRKNNHIELLRKWLFSKNDLKRVVAVFVQGLKRHAATQAVSLQRGESRPSFPGENLQVSGV